LLEFVARMVGNHRQRPVEHFSFPCHPRSRTQIAKGDERVSAWLSSFTWQQFFIGRPQLRVRCSTRSSNWFLAARHSAA
jgi:hypothetical protein